MSKLLGKLSIILFVKDSGTVVDLTGMSRSFSIEQQAQSIDVSTRADILAGERDTEADAPERSWNCSGLDSRPAATRVWKGLDIGDTGRVFHYPAGSGASAPVEHGKATVEQLNQESPHDGPQTWTVSGKLKSYATTAMPGS